MKNQVLNSINKIDLSTNGQYSLETGPEETTLLNQSAMTKSKREKGTINITDASPTKEQKPLLTSELTKKDIEEMGNKEFFKLL